MSERFYTNWPLQPGPFEMTGPEARHLTTVCRFRAGDELCLFNGDGKEYPARLLETSKKSVLLEVIQVAGPQRELGFVLEIAAPIPKGDRTQFLLEKLTELGVTSFVPLLTKRSIIQPREGKMEKLERYVVEASKQCGRNVLMTIKEPIAWGDYCEQGSLDEMRILAHPFETVSPMDKKGKDFSNIRCAVGAEGGFTEDEVTLGINQGWQIKSLGPRIMRIETAAVFLAIHAIIKSPFSG